MTESPWTFFGEYDAVSSDDTVTMVDGTTFMVCRRNGDVHGHGPFGLFMLDTRVVSTWLLNVGGSPVTPLSVTPNGPFSAVFVGRAEVSTAPDNPLTVIQRRHVGQGMREDLEIRNHGSDPVPLTVELRVGSDFGGVFDVKAGRNGAPTMAVSQDDENSLVIPAPERPGAAVIEATVITCSTNPDRADERGLAWDVTLQPGQKWENCLVVEVINHKRRLRASYQCGQPIDEAIPVNRLRRWRESVTTITTDDARLSQAVDRASEDLGSLRIFDPDHPERVVVAAGAPWFMTLFGRDSLIAAWMSLPLDHDLAEGVLKELQDKQGTEVDPRTEEQPGRILHEVRFDGASARLLGGANTYYGSIDATPLFVMLVAELARWTGITETIRNLLPAVDRAMMWISEFGHRDDDGFVEYLRSDPTGLLNQGWKDSRDGIRHLDGRLPSGPIALCEVQGYVYAAHRGRAELARATQEHDLAARHDQLADDLREAFDQAFWLDELGWYAVGLDGDKQPIASLTSNIGHLLWTGIIDAERAELVAERLVGSSMFSGWGLRTLSTDSGGYDPLSYHCGSVWPHDTALAVAGLSRYGFDQQANRLSEGLLAAAACSGGRLPELFAGFACDDLPAPVPYPASCSPQAWAAASPLLLVRAMLGLEPNMLTGRFKLRPRLPPGIGALTLTDIPFGRDRVTVAAGTDEVMVTGLGSHVTVEIDHPGGGAE